MDYQYQCCDILKVVLGCHVSELSVTLLQNSTAAFNSASSVPGVLHPRNTQNEDSKCWYYLNMYIVYGGTLVPLLRDHPKVHSKGGVFMRWTFTVVDLQSINQSNFYSANIPGEATLSGATAESVFNSNDKVMKQSHNINGSSGVLVSMGGGKAMSSRSDALGCEKVLSNEGMISLEGRLMKYRLLYSG